MHEVCQFKFKTVKPERVFRVMIVPLSNLIQKHEPMPEVCQFLIKTVKTCI